MFFLRVFIIGFFLGTFLSFAQEKTLEKKATIIHELLERNVDPILSVLRVQMKKLTKNTKKRMREETKVVLHETIKLLGKIKPKNSEVINELLFVFTHVHNRDLLKEIAEVLGKLASKNPRVENAVSKIFDPSLVYNANIPFHQRFEIAKILCGFKTLEVKLVEKLLSKKSKNNIWFLSRLFILGRLKTQSIKVAKKLLVSDFREGISRLTVWEALSRSGNGSEFNAVYYLYVNLKKWGKKLKDWYDGLEPIDSKAVKVLLQALKSHNKDIRRIPVLVFRFGKFHQRDHKAIIKGLSDFLSKHDAAWTWAVYALGNFVQYQHPKAIDTLLEVLETSKSFPGNGAYVLQALSLIKKGTPKIREKLLSIAKNNPSISSSGNKYSTILSNKSYYTAQILIKLYPKDPEVVKVLLEKLPQETKSFAHLLLLRSLNKTLNFHPSIP